MQAQSKKGPHVGRNIQTFRFIRGLSQTGLAAELEERLKKPISQQLISDIESREDILDDELLAQIAEILKVSPDALKKLDMESAITVVGNTFNNNDGSLQNYNLPIYHNSTINQTYNPLEKLIELFEKEKAELKAEIEKLKRKKK
jgi:transcriptional regulator with XRE-family HTH domain